MDFYIVEVFYGSFDEWCNSDLLKEHLANLSMITLWLTLFAETMFYGLDIKASGVSPSVVCTKKIQGDPNSYVAKLLCYLRNVLTRQGQDCSWDQERNAV